MKIFLLILINVSIFVMNGNCQDNNIYKDIIEIVKKERKSTSLPFEDYQKKLINYDKSKFDFTDRLDITVSFTNLITEVQIPKRVKYKKDTEATVTAILELGYFLGNNEPIFADEVYIGPHLYEILSRNPQFMKMGILNLIPIQIQKKVECYVGLILKDENEKKLFGNYIRKQFINEKEVLVRKPTKNEIDWYWTVISYDIEEPILVVEFKNRKFILNFRNNLLFYIDDISGLIWNYE
jgi:hypothetical protein